MSEMRGEYGVESMDEQVEKRISLDVPKALAKTLTLGDSITATVSGQVCGISTGYDKGDAKTICLDIKFAKPPRIVTNQADASVRSMMGTAPKVGRTKNEADKSLKDLRDSVERSY